MKHVPVLLKEFLEFFQDVSIRVFFDGTLGLGGHAKALLEAHPEMELFLGCDRDVQAIEIAEKQLAPWKSKVQIFQGSFENMKSFLKKAKVQCVDGCFFDLGVSSLQFDTGSRGFSFQKEAALDMRMNLSDSLTAEEVVNTYPEKTLEKIFREFGEERKSKKAAAAIVCHRRKKKIYTTKDLVEVLLPVLPRYGKLHPATLIFQALRICVNHELEALEKVLPVAEESLCEKGGLGVISFHSLEDRIVKQYLKNSSGLEIFTKKPIVASEEEKRKNPRSRSAKMRLAKKREIYE
ncbi:MAG: 16S rRNA (cytosine(1402)-N(4))-methyltransferase RsmH [Chlamydiota bacterium]